MGLKSSNKLRIIKKDFIFIINSKVVENNKEIEKKIRVDSSVIRYLTVKYKALDTKNEFFKKNNKDS